MQPTIIFVAKDAAGGDVAGVMVAIDGKPGVRLEGAELPVDWESTIASDQGTYIDCNDNGGHADLGRLTELQGVSWQFLHDHPFGIQPEPYTSLPSGFPSYCALNAAGTPP